MEHPEMSAALTAFARTIAIQHRREPFRHAIFITSEARGDLHLNGSMKVYVHPRLLTPETSLLDLTQRVFDIIDEKALALLRERSRIIQASQEVAEWHIDYIRRHSTPEEFDDWIGGLT